MLYPVELMANLTHLNCRDIASRRTFLAILNGKLNLLAFVQRFKTAALDGREMHKHVFATIIRGDKAKSFGLIKPFY